MRSAKSETIFQIELETHPITFLSLSKHIFSLRIGGNDRTEKRELKGGERTMLLRRVDWKEGRTGQRQKIWLF